MNCSRDLIEAYMDEELDPGLSAAVEEHLSSCLVCSEAHSRFREQKASIRSIAPYYTAPAQLRQSVRQALRQAANETFSTHRLRPMRCSRSSNRGSERRGSKPGRTRTDGLNRSP